MITPPLHAKPFINRRSSASLSPDLYCVPRYDAPDTPLDTAGQETAGRIIGEPMTPPRTIRKGYHVLLQRSGLFCSPFVQIGSQTGIRSTSRSMRAPPLPWRGTARQWQVRARSPYGSRLIRGSKHQTRRSRSSLQ